MNTDGHGWAKRMLVAAVAAVLPSVGLAAEAKGLDGVGDAELVQELSRYGFDDLVDRYFATHDVPAAQQADVRAMMAARALVSSGDKLPAAQRQQVVRRIVEGADKIIPAMQEPRQLMQLATALITVAVERDANTIEYWGENPRAHAELRPAAELVARVLDACSQKAREQADKLVAGFGNNPSPAQLRQYTALDNLATNARYTRLMADYYRAMAFPAGDPQRGQIADAAIEGLKEYDSTESQVQAAVRLRIGKLLMVKGEWAKASQVLGSVAADAERQIEPAPGILQQYEARYFIAVCELLSRKPDATARAMQELTGWEGANLPQDERIRAGARSAMAMLSYRLEVLRTELASDDAERKAARAKADATLKELAQEQPELRPAVYEQLARSLPEDADLKTLDPLMLKALVQQGIIEQRKPQGVVLDCKVIERAIGAAGELMSRRGQTGVDAQLVDDASIVMPQLQEKLGRDTEAARGYLAYVEMTALETNRAAAVQNALAVINRIKAANPQSADAEAMLDRALSLAVMQVGMRELAYDLGRRLQRAGKYDDAVAAYRLVPESDRRWMSGRFYQIQAMKQGMDAAGAGLDAKARAAQTSAICELAEDLRKRMGSAQDRGAIDVRLRLIVASVLKDSSPVEAVRQLEGFEQTVAGMSDGDQLESEALFLRTKAQMALGQNTQATQSLLQLLQTRSGEQGATIIFGLLKQLDADLDLTRRAGDAGKAKSLLDARAALSGPLVEWASSNRDEQIRKHAYQYMVFDAATKQQAAMVEPDPVRRAEALRQVLGLYSKLMEGENIRRWAATVDPAKVDVKYGDVAVLFAKAQVLFELGEYREAASRFGRLLEDRKLGTPRIISTRDGEIVSEDNPQYWEATWKLYRANSQLAGAAGNPDGPRLLQETGNGLKRLYIREGDGVGGEKWRRQFEELRKELIPDFQIGPATTNP